MMNNSDDWDDEDNDDDDWDDEDNNDDIDNDRLHYFARTYMHV